MKINKIKKSLPGVKKMNKATIKTFFEIMNNRNLDKLSSMLTDNVEFYFPKTQLLIGKE